MMKRNTVLTAPGRWVRGFTMIELMIVVALGAIVLALAAPSFTTTLAKKRMEGVASELGTDIQYARSEAVQRNASIRIIFGSNCYTIHTVGTTDATDCATLGTGAVSLKSVILPAGSAALAFTSYNSKAFIEFEPVRGMAADIGGADSSGRVDVTSGSGSWQLRADVTHMGRVRNCSPNSSIPGMPACS
jgi:type IV fimbrial biogenesis protein FimT